MKKKSLKVVIADPCHENWDKMSPTDQGRFCSSCAKPVIDFSGMSDLRLTEFLQENKGQHMCGRFAEGQLNRTLMQPLPVQKTSHLRTVLLGATLTSVFGLESCKSSDTRTVGAWSVYETDTEQTSVSGQGETKPNLISSGKKSNLVLSGIVTEEHSLLGISNVRLVLYSADRKEITSTRSKKDGSFKLTVNPDKDPTYIIAYSDNYMEKMISLGDLKEMQNLVIGLRSGEIMMKGDVMIIEE